MSARSLSWNRMVSSGYEGKHLDGGLSLGIVLGEIPKSGGTKWRDEGEINGFFYIFLSSIWCSCARALMPLWPKQKTDADIDY